MAICPPPPTQAYVARGMRGEEGRGGRGGEREGEKGGKGGKEGKEKGGRGKRGGRGGRGSKGKGGWEQALFPGGESWREDVLRDGQRGLVDLIWAGNRSPST